MNCPKCHSDNCKKSGKGRKGQQRLACRDCGTRYVEPTALGSARTPIETAAKALNMLLEGMSIRATARLTGLDKNTIQRLMETAGRQCAQFMADTMQGLEVTDVQCDEVWSFVGMKEKAAAQQGWGDVGDAYVFTAVDRESKLLLCFHVGRRSGEDAETFSRKLACCISADVRPQVSTDGFRPYHVTIPDAFNYRVDHGMVIKQFGTTSQSPNTRYSPAAIIGTKLVSNVGQPNAERICTSHVERHNLTIRMQNRRFTRLTNAFSKKWENHEAMFALFAAWYNFCRKHQTVGTTPAVAAGVTGEVWTIERLLIEAAKATAI